MTWQPPCGLESEMRKDAPAIDREPACCQAEAKTKVVAEAEEEEEAKALELEWAEWDLLV